MQCEAVQMKRKIQKEDKIVSPSQQLRIIDIQQPQELKVNVSLSQLRLLHVHVYVCEKSFRHILENL